MSRTKTPPNNLTQSLISSPRPTIHTAQAIHAIHARSAPILLQAQKPPSPLAPSQSSQTAFFRLSASSASLLSRSLRSSRALFSLSRVTRSNSLSSSLRFGARTPSAPAISLPATAVVFSGRRAGLAVPLLFPLPLREPRPLSPAMPPYAAAGAGAGKSNGAPTGEAGVGGGG